MSEYIQLAQRRASLLLNSQTSSYRVLEATNLQDARSKALQRRREGLSINKTYTCWGQFASLGLGIRSHLISSTLYTYKLTLSASVPQTKIR